MSLTDRRGVAVDLGPTKPRAGRPLKAWEVRALAVAALYQAGFPVPLAMRALKVSHTGFYRDLDHAADLAARHAPGEPSA